MALKPLFQRTLWALRVFAVIGFFSPVCPRAPNCGLTCSSVTTARCVRRRGFHHLRDHERWPGVYWLHRDFARQLWQGQTQRLPIELPTGTTKRVVIPTFSPSRYPTPMDVQLIDSRGKVRGELLGARPQRQIGWETKLIGSLPRTAAGTVALCSTKRDQPDIQPASARFQPAMFPDNPLVLEGLMRSI